MYLLNRKLKTKKSASRTNSKSLKPSSAKALTSINFSAKRSKWKPTPTVQISSQIKIPKKALIITQMSLNTQESVGKAFSRQLLSHHNKWPHPPILNSRGLSNPFR
jgi:hypothetical protein